MEGQEITSHMKVVVNAQYREQILEEHETPAAYVAAAGLPRKAAREFLCPGRMYTVIEVRRPSLLLVQIRLKEKPRRWYASKFFDQVSTCEKQQKNTNGPR